MQTVAENHSVKLVNVGLIEPRIPPPTAPGLGEWLDKYIGQRRAELKPSSIVKLERTAHFLKAFFGEAIGIDALDEDGAHDWRSWLRTQGVNNATAGTHVRNVKQIFTHAVKRKLIGGNPFCELVGSIIAADRDRYITPEETDKIIEACPDIRWRTLFGLARLAGLRVTSETHILTWADIDWDRGRMSVQSPKTERFLKHRRRAVPIVPKLMAILQGAFDEAEEGQERVVRLSRNNLHRTMPQILKRAGIEPWKDCFQALRRSCDTELKQTFPSYAVDAWLGHSGPVSEKHYLMITDELWGRAGDYGNQSAGQSAAECAAANSRIDSQRLAKGESANDMTFHETAENTGSNDDMETSGARGRTGDLGFMNPTL